MIKTIIFDMGGVLVDNPWPGMVKHYIKHLEVEEETFNKVFNNIGVDWQKGKLSEKEFWQAISSALNSEKSVPEQLWIEGYKTTYNEKKETFQLIKNLKKKGYKIALLSNTETPIVEFVVEKHYEDFDEFMYSCEMGMVKPDKDIFEEALKRLKIKPAEAVMIDDKGENILAAKQVGMKGIVFQDIEQVKKDLQILLNNNE